MTASVAAGAAAACIASCMYDVGVALQALEAGTTDAAEGLKPRLLRQLIARGRWLAGLSLNLLGWPFHAAAFALAPVSVVQACPAFGLMPLLVIGARRLDEPVGAPQLQGVLAIVAGVVCL